MKDDFRFTKRISRILQARQAACKVLGVSEGAYRNDLKKRKREKKAEHVSEKEKWKL